MELNHVPKTDRKNVSYIMLLVIIWMTAIKERMLNGSKTLFQYGNEIWLLRKSE